MIDAGTVTGVIAASHRIAPSTSTAAAAHSGRADNAIRPLLSKRLRSRMASVWAGARDSLRLGIPFAGGARDDPGLHSCASLRPTARHRQRSGWLDTEPFGSRAHDAGLGTN